MYLILDVGSNVLYVFACICSTTTLCTRSHRVNKR